jgi:hypothetical protein
VKETSLLKLEKRIVWKANVLSKHLKEEFIKS